MNKLIKLLMYVPGFIEGNFVQAIKTVFNAESMKYVKVNDDRDRVLDLQKLLQALHDKFGSDVVQLYTFMTFLQVVIKNELQAFFKNDFHGIKTERGYSNLLRIANFIRDKLLNPEMHYVDAHSKDALRKFQEVLLNVPMGKQKKLVVMTCRYCTNGKAYGDVTCNVCNGIGKVQQWQETGDALDEQSINKLYSELIEIAPIVAEILNTYIQYLISITMYESVFTINHSLTDDDKFRYNGGIFTTPIYCNVKGDKKFPNRKIEMIYTYNNVEYALPALVMVPEMVEEKPSKFKSEKFASAPKTLAHESKANTVNNGNNITSSTEETYIYTKKNGEKVIGYDKPKWEKYYMGKSDKVIIYYPYDEYSRDEVRQAFATIVGLPKSEISVKTIS